MHTRSTRLPWGRAHIHPSPSTSHPRSKKLPLVRSMHAARASLPRRYLFSAICGYARGQRDAAVVASSASKIGQARQWSNAPASLAVAAATGLQQSIPCREHNGRLARVLRQLSAGEKALTAIALLFSIYQVKPSPYCILDEVDAPLDDVNIRKFTRVLNNFSNDTQFIVVTHNKLTMESANFLYGVTMEKKGVSQLVSVKLD